MAGILLIDRDGTLIEEKHYLSDPDDVVLLPGAAEGLKAFRTAGFKLVLVTNQSGIGRGYFSEQRLREIHDRLEAMLAESGVTLDGIYYCPHTPDDRCACRKPETGLAEAALAAFGSPDGTVVVIGDKAIDIELGKRISARTVLVRTGYGEQEARSGKVLADVIADSIKDAAHLLGLE